jgi:hypothetical protein
VNYRAASFSLPAPGVPFHILRREGVILLPDLSAQVRKRIASSG